MFYEHDPAFYILNIRLQKRSDNKYPQNSNISRTLLGIKLVDL